MPLVTTTKLSKIKPTAAVLVAQQTIEPPLAAPLVTELAGVSGGRIRRQPEALRLALAWHKCVLESPCFSPLPRRLANEPKIKWETPNLPLWSFLVKGRFLENPRHLSTTAATPPRR
jgi:hypothetical protein